MGARDGTQYYRNNVTETHKYSKRILTTALSRSKNQGMVKHRGTPGAAKKCICLLCLIRVFLYNEKAN
jgi:hypothetical protein